MSFLFGVLLLNFWDLFLFFSREEEVLLGFLKGFGDGWNYGSTFLLKIFLHVAILSHSFSKISTSALANLRGPGSFYS